MDRRLIIIPIVLVAAVLLVNVLLNGEVPDQVPEMIEQDADGAVVASSAPEENSVSEDDQVHNGDSADTLDDGSSSDRINVDAGRRPSGKSTVTSGVQQSVEVSSEDSDSGTDDGSGSESIAGTTGETTDEATAGTTGGTTGESSDETNCEPGIEISAESGTETNHGTSGTSESIPEFPTIGLPVALVLGLAFFFRKD